MWTLRDEYVQVITYNIHKDPLAPQIPLTAVTSQYNRTPFERITQIMYDDGRHFDADSGDGIYASYDSAPLSDFADNEYSVDTIFDTLGISRISNEIPLVEIPGAPRILSPTSPLHATTNFDIAFVNPGSDGGRVMLTQGTWRVGSIPEHVFWSDTINPDRTGRLSIMRFPLGISQGSEYRVIVWTHFATNPTLFQRGAYALDFMNFAVDTSARAVTSIELAPNFPNPFNTTTVVSWTQSNNSTVSVSILDILGRVVKRLSKPSPYSPGTHYIVWDGRDDRGVGVGSGSYFLQVNSDGLRQTRRVLLLK